MTSDTLVLVFPFTVIAVTCTYIGGIIFRWLRKGSKLHPIQNDPRIKISEQSLEAVQPSSADEYHSLSMELSELLDIPLENLKLSGNMHALRLRVEQKRSKQNRLDKIPSEGQDVATGSTANIDEYHSLSMELSELIGVPLEDTCLSGDVDALRLRVEKVRHKGVYSIDTPQLNAAATRIDVADFKDMDKFNEYMTSVMYEFPHIEFLVKVAQYNEAYIFTIKLPKTNLNTVLRLKIRKNGSLSLDLNSNLYTNIKSLSESYHEKIQPKVQVYRGPTRKVFSQEEHDKLSLRRSREIEKKTAYEFSRHIIEGSILEIEYRDKGGDVTRRKVKVLQEILYKNGKQSFSAYCYLRSSKRTFLISGIKSLAPQNSSNMKPLASKSGSYEHSPQEVYEGDKAEVYDQDTDTDFSRENDWMAQDYQEEDRETDLGYKDDSDYC